MFVALLALAGCSFPDDTSSGSDKSFCYKRRDGTACSCFAEEQSLAASDWATTTSCTGTCCADTDTSGATSTCVCGTVARQGCGEYEDGSCRCDGSAAVLGPKERAVERCSAKAGQECCEDSAAAKAFCSCEGKACADQRITLNKVSSCSRRATVKIALLAQGVDVRSFPTVLQYNKQDLPADLILSHADLDEALNFRGLRSFPGDALRGAGMSQTLKGISELVLKRLAQTGTGAA